MIIAVDIDNTINNLQEVVTELFNKRHNANYTLDNFHDYDIANDLPKKDATKMKKIYGESGLYDLVKPLPMAQDCLQKLVNAGHHVYLVTDAIPKTYGEKVDWLHHYFPFIDNSRIVSMSHKWLFKCDVMVEDNLQNLITGHHYDRICMNCSWNKNIDDWVYDIHRCEDWNDVVRVINKLNERE